MSGPGSSNAFGINCKVGDSNSPHVWIHFLSQKVDIFKTPSVRESKMNVVARAQSTFQMLTLLQKYLYHQSQYSKTWDNKCLALISQMVRAFGINPKVGGSSTPQVETFSVSKPSTRSQEHRSCVANQCCCPGIVNTSNVNFTTKISIALSENGEMGQALIRSACLYVDKWHICIEAV